MHKLKRILQGEKMKYVKIIILMLSGWFAHSTQAATDWVIDATVTKVEFYGNQFTVYFDKTHTATACGNTMSVAAMDTASEPGKSHYSFFLVAYSAQKKVSVRVNDGNCSGDRPTIIQIVGN